MLIRRPARSAPSSLSTCVWIGSLCLVTSLMAVDTAEAQFPSTVQLPSLSRFSYNGTVMVPDGGSAHLGSVSRAASGSSRRGLNRAFGSQQSLSQASAHVQIIDLAEMDRQILGGTPEEFVRRERLKAERTGVDPNVMIDPDARGKALVRLARKEWTAGNRSVAFDHYRTAIASLQSDRLRDYAVGEFKRRYGTSAVQTLQMARLR